MELLYTYRDEIKSKLGQLRGCCELELTSVGDVITLKTEFRFLYPRRFGTKPSNLIYTHRLDIDTKNCIYATTSLSDYKQANSKPQKPKVVINNFASIENVISRGLIEGESRFNFWGARYKRATKKISELIIKRVKPLFTNEYYKNKNNNYSVDFSPLYVTLVDYYLDFNGIKGHDNVYRHIQTHLPKKKWLKANQMKFLPAVLDSMGLKNKYLIGVLNDYRNNVNLISLKTLCGLFGSNYIDYIKKMNWIDVCASILLSNQKPDELKNETEKNNFVQLSKNWLSDEDINIHTYSFLYHVSRLLYRRKNLEAKGLDLKFSAKTREDYERLEVEWLSFSEYFRRGYKLKYEFPVEFLKTIEEPIVVGDIKFRVKLLTSEDEFKVEGIKMKNCMGNQFQNGIIQNFFAIQYRRKRINLSVQRGQFIQAFGKSNSTIPDIFKEPIEVILERYKAFSDLKWNKTRYDILK